MFHVKHSRDSLGLSPAAVVDALRSARVTVTQAQAELLIQHADLVLEANQVMNLTRITSRKGVLSLHIVDSLAFLPHVEPLAGLVVDLGSGAGYPGIPLAILGAEMVLCESVKKKAAFLEHSCAALGLQVSVQPLRAEELVSVVSGSADVVVARAVSVTASLLELAAPLLRTSGRLIALKGIPSEEELAGARRAEPLCGMAESARVEYALPTGERRTVLVFEKIGKPRRPLPRRPGTAQQEPLG